ncbi:MAG TPA: hypothetical protein VGR35_12765 [Tepidisphaeraceae bacterium]|nr:hypothetical protein [Tepidisphaeraceae bacterium]
MLLSSWLPDVKPSAPAARGRVRKSLRSRDRVRPQMESLEDRQLLSTVTVTSLGDSGPGSLRDAIALAASGDTIVFAPTLFSSTTTSTSTTSTAAKGNGNGKGRVKNPPPPPNTIVLSSGQLTLAKNLTIDGPSTSQLTITTTATNRIFEVAQNTTVTLSRMTISKGYSGYGAGVFNQGGLTLDACTVSDNYAIYTGGGIYNVGTLSTNNSTFSGNQARFGGAIYNAGGMVTIDSTSISGNTAFHSDYPWSGGDGGGIYNEANGTVIVRNFSSITGNTSQWYEGQGPDVYNLGTIYRDSTSTIGLLDGNAAVLI